ncbi:Putative glycoside hydrolase, family 28, pectin lyase/virulence factor [Septoria linicola]|uniref:Glycoside hydrolase, family 28, pectin lyase/virulence factor n=1 Tax=Septoria linicola TaxID=215465 RepID=A0A9Q9AUI0_9PEZI|nr:Putative glycoside hydrolase, family 28, pectin lyase/virulence factor [Septoria linicola]
MTALIARLLALSQAPLFPQDVRNNLGKAKTTVSRSVDTEITFNAENGQGCNSDRYDPYVCECLGLNGCWSPSEVQEGPPYSHDEPWPERSKTCNVPAGGDPNGDDAPAILKAFADCKEDGHIVFENTTYYIGTIMNTTGLKDVTVELRGTMLWDTNIPYWLANSMPIGFQNQTAAWHLGGENLHFYGHGYGTLDGNGQAWYNFNQGVSNRHGRPHAILITNTKNAVIEGLRFLKPQMWTMTLARSEKVLLQDIYIDATSEARDFRSNVNTDGVDTVYANNITFLRWTIDNGDDSISMKQNSTNIYIANCTFYNGQSLAMGSIGQYPGQIEVIENITAVDIKCVNTGYGARVKTWTGKNKGFPPNGGGGGLGWAKNISFTNFELEDVNLAWAISQCTSYNGQRGDCNSSDFQISDMHWGKAKGTLKGDRVATLQCSAEAPCTNINLFDNDLWALDQNIPSYSYLCEEVVNPTGFNCTGACNGQCPR